MEALAALQPALKQALEQSVPLDAALGVPAGASAVAVTGLLVLVTLLWCCGCFRKKGGKKSKRAIKNTVLLIGPPGSGKTAMLHQVRTLVFSFLHRLLRSSGGQPLPLPPDVRPRPPTRHL
jgi:hypothetical protein